MYLCLAIIGPDGDIKAEAFGEGEINLVYRSGYELGDVVRLTTSGPGHLILGFDAAISPALLFMSATEFHYPVPVGQSGIVLSPVAFTGTMHRLYARQATQTEITAKRNLACNPLDGHSNAVLYPHASANVETRGEAAFAARNAIDGEKANNDHGKWPFTSWGINQDPEAALTIEFGRTVQVDELKIYLRADFPHDAWWKMGTVTFSDGATTRLSLSKSSAAQGFSMPPRRIEWLKLHDLIKADDPSPFPALTQIEVWGREG